MVKNETGHPIDTCSICGAIRSDEHGEGCARSSDETGAWERLRAFAEEVRDAPQSSSPWIDWRAKARAALANQPEPTRGAEEEP